MRFAWAVLFGVAFWFAYSLFSQAPQPFRPEARVWNQVEKYFASVGRYPDSLLAVELQRDYFHAVGLKVGAFSKRRRIYWVEEAGEGLPQEKIFFRYDYGGPQGPIQIEPVIIPP